MEMVSFINDIVRNNVRSMYMVNLYEEKNRARKYLTSEEKDDYIEHCATLDATSRIMVPVFKRLLSDIPFSELNEHGRKILNINAVIYKEVFGEETNIEEQQEILRKGQSGICSIHSVNDESYHFGKVDLSKMRNMLVYDGNKMFGYADLCNQTFVELLNSNTIDEAVEELSQMVIGIDELPVNEQTVLFDKLGICFAPGIVPLRFHTALFDREYSKRKYPEEAEWLANEKEYKDLLAEVGIDMGEMPKTFVGEIYGYTNSSSNGVAKH